MPYINIIIPRRFQSFYNGSGTNFYDTFEDYLSRNYSGLDNFDKNVLNNILNINIIGKTNGKLFSNVSYNYDDFESNQVGFNRFFTGDFLYSGYYIKDSPQGKTIWPVNYLYDSFELYSVGSITTYTNNIFVCSGYNEYLGLVTGKSAISGNF